MAQTPPRRRKHVEDAAYSEGIDRALQKLRLRLSDVDSSRNHRTWHATNSRQNYEKHFKMLEFFLKRIGKCEQFQHNSNNNIFRRL